MRTTILTAAACFAAALSTSARSQTAPDAPSEPATQVVSYADLDLDEPEDTSILDDRLRAAARRLCHEVHRSSAMTHYRVLHLCRRDSLDDARRQVAANKALADASGNRAVTFSARGATRTSED